MKKNFLNNINYNMTSPSYIPTIRSKLERKILGRNDTKILEKASNIYSFGAKTSAYINSIVFISTNKKSIYSYKDFLKHTFSKHFVDFYIFVLPVKKKKIILLKSPHVYKKAKENFELKLFRFIFKTVSLQKFLIKDLILNKPKNIKCILKSQERPFAYMDLLVQATIQAKKLFI